MSMLEIVTYPDNFLRRHAIPVKNIDGKIQEMIENMAFTMYKASGVGLAAIQVGCDKSIIVYDIAPAEEKRSLCALINPKIIFQRIIFFWNLFRNICFLIFLKFYNYII